MFAMLAAAFVLGVVVAMPPGPVVISSGQRALSTGFWSAFAFNMGALTSDTLYACLVYFGISALMTESAGFRLALWALGGAWLIWLGIDAIRTRIELDDMDAAQRKSYWHNYRDGVFITLLNPMTIVAWVALAGNFFAVWDAGWPPVESAGLLAVLAMVIGAVAWVLAIALALSISRRFFNPRLLRIVSAGSGLFLIGFGLLAWSSALELVVG